MKSKCIKALLVNAIIHFKHPLRHFGSFLQSTLNRVVLASEAVNLMERPGAFNCLKFRSSSVAPRLTPQIASHGLSSPLSTNLEVDFSS